MAATSEPAKVTHATVIKPVVVDSLYQKQLRESKDQLAQAEEQLSELKKSMTVPPPKKKSEA